jgi:hypothetical protein
LSSNSALKLGSRVRVSDLPAATDLRIVAEIRTQQGVLQLSALRHGVCHDSLRRKSCVVNSPLVGDVPDAVL